ncbi:hypothetical protein D9M70_617560 [compost metagenome]
MGRHGVVGNGETAGDLAGRQSLRLRTHQQAEDVETSVLRQRRQGEDDLFIFHISRLIDIWKMTQASFSG